MGDIDWHNKIILVVEDDEASFKYISEILYRTKIKLLHVKDGIQAFAECINNPVIDLVLMDIQIKGDIDGIETASQIQEKFALPIVFLTANSDEKTLNRADQILSEFRQSL